MCKHEKCQLPVKQRGYCAKHYMQWYRGNLSPYYCNRCGHEIKSKTANKKFCDICRNIQIKESNVKRTNRDRSKKKQGISYSKIDLYSWDFGICYLCGLFVSYEEFHVEHIIPISGDGEDRPENVAVSHPSCNRRKGVLKLDQVVKIFPRMKVPERFNQWQRRNTMFLVSN